MSKELSKMPLQLQNGRPLMLPFVQAGVVPYTRSQKQVKIRKIYDYTQYPA